MEREHSERRVLEQVCVCVLWLSRAISQGESEKEEVTPTEPQPGPCLCFLLGPWRSRPGAAARGGTANAARARLARRGGTAELL